MMEGNTRLLQPAVMTSSSLRYLRNLMAEVSGISGVNHFELTILREIDIRQMRLHPLCKTSFHDCFDDRIPDAGEILATKELIPIVIRWLDLQCREALPLRNLSQSPPQGVDHPKESAIRVVALSTYFPHITSMNAGLREAAMTALVGAIQIALGLKQHGWMEHPIIQIVCGTVLDPCPCTECRAKKRVFVYERTDKIDLLCQSLKETIRRVEAEYKAQAPQNEVPQYTLALEVEPGANYVLNGLEWVLQTEQKIRQEEALQQVIGWNLDIAHFMVTPITAAEFQPLHAKIVHAHISDLPGTHLRDQVVGTWTSIVRRGEMGYIPYLRLLTQRLQSIEAQGTMPFSGAFSLELEGCNRINWIHHSLSAMRHLRDMVFHYPSTSTG